jgi:protein-arginine deiminase
MKGKTSLLLHLALAARAIGVSCLKPDIRADSNRDGVVDVKGSSDSGNKALWTPQHGAIFLPNIGDKLMRCTRTDAIGNPWSNDELSACHDASGHLLFAPEYVAPIKTLPLNVSEEAEAHIYATPRAAYDRVRLFVLDNPSDINSTTSWRLVDQEFSFNSTQLRSGITLGMDGRELATNSSIWDGSVTVRFDVTDGATHASDAVALKMAPVLTHNHLQAVETLLSTASNSSNPIQLDFVHELDEARGEAGITNPLLLFNQSSDIWTQDFIEPGYASMPGPNGPISIRVLLRSPQSTRTGGRQVFEQLRGPGIGGFQPVSGSGSGFGHREIDSYGNLETIPPYTSKSGVSYKAGRIIMGKHFDELPTRALLDFLYAQQVQSPLILEAGWLIVGHVDEFVQFLPYDNDLGFAISIADTESAISLLKDLEANGHGGTRASSYESSSDVTLYEPSLNLTITELLSNTTFITANAYAQRHLDANLQTLLSEIPLDPSDIIRIPTLFRDSNFPFDMSQGINGLPGRVSPTLAGERKLMSFFPASINGIVLGERYIGPRSWGPVVNGTDVLAKAVEGAYARAGMSVRWIDDFLSHHVWGGEVHCGSNTLRQTDLVWWE